MSSNNFRALLRWANYSLGLLDIDKTNALSKFDQGRGIQYESITVVPPPNSSSQGTEKKVTN